MEEVKTWDVALVDTTEVLVEREFASGETLSVVDDAPLLELFVDTEVIDELTDEELETDLLVSEVSAVVVLEVTPLNVTEVLTLCVVLDACVEVAV